jgi:hypothetical protein
MKNWDDQAAKAWCRGERYTLGGTPITRLKALLKALSEW